MRRFAGRDLVAELAMLERSGNLVGNVLDQGAIESDVEELNSPANAENGPLGLERGPNQGKLEVVPLLIETVSLGVSPILAETARIDISATGKEEGVDQVEICWNRAGSEGEDDGGAAGRLDRGGVIARKAIAMNAPIGNVFNFWPRRDADDWSAVHAFSPA
jgi:hypothetical protein